MLQETEGKTYFQSVPEALYLLKNMHAKMQGLFFVFFKEVKTRLDLHRSKASFHMLVTKQLLSCSGLIISSPRHNNV